MKKTQSENEGDSVFTKCKFLIISDIMVVLITGKNDEDPIKNKGARVLKTLNEPPHGKANNLPRRKQRRRSACSNCEADQRLCFRYSDSTVPLLPKSKISSF